MAPSSPKIERCRSHRCRAQIIWVRSAVSNKLMPLDAEPTESGNIVIGPDLFGDLSAVVEPSAKMPRYLSHFATCPDAERFRKD